MCNSFFEYLKSEGYYFDEKIVVNFLLSLKVKPFVIFSGNSGTGKTQLAKLFSEYLFTKKNFKSVELNKDGNKFTLNTFYDKEQSLQDTFSIHPFFKYGEDYPIKIKLNDEEYSGKIHYRFQHKFKLNSTNGGDAFNHLKTINENLYERVEGLLSEDNDKETIINLLTEYELPDELIDCVDQKLQDKSNYNLKNDLSDKVYKKIFDNLFSSEKNKIEIDKVEVLVQCDSNYNYKIVPVGANWTDNTNILGFFNIISGSYHKTPAFQIITEAIANKSFPYFLILDEMNLSHVERYFADFLSAMESNKPIPLYGCPKYKDSDNEVEFNEEDKEIELPPNLFIIGTVNIDETTYMFSPKVLDRANTIEFSTMKPSEYLTTDNNLSNTDNNLPNDKDVDLDYLENPMDGVDKKIEEIFKEFENVHVKDDTLLSDKLNDELDAFYGILKEINFDFGFRVTNEILKFMYAAWKYENSHDTWENWNDYFDAQIIQKILPKIHGSEREIKSTLSKLLDKCKDDYLCSYEKLESMLKTLNNQKYVSFIN